LSIREDYIFEEKRNLTIIKKRALYYQTVAFMLGLIDRNVMRTFFPMNICLRWCTYHTG